MNVTNETLAQLRLPFPSAGINWRIGQTNAEKTQGQALPYLDGRAVQNRLDDVLGAQNWQVEYKSSPLSNGLICRLGIRIGGQWVFKEDGAQLNAVRSDGSNTREMAVKGAYTDAFKRAAVMWGIGRYLYGFSAPWVAIERTDSGYVFASTPRLPAHMLPADEQDETASPSAAAPSEAPAAAPSEAPAAVRQGGEEAKPAQTQRPQAAAPTNERASRPAQPAARTAAPATRVPGAASATAAPRTAQSSQELPEGLNDEERAIVLGLLEKIARPAIPMTMLENYIAGPRVSAKLSAAAMAFLNARLAERRQREAAAA